MTAVFFIYRCFQKDSQGEALLEKREWAGRGGVGVRPLPLSLFSSDPLADREKCEHGKALEVPYLCLKHR